ncbi:hypothetical protein D3C83_105550 [compost metagenome]
MGVKAIQLLVYVQFLRKVHHLLLQPLAIGIGRNFGQPRDDPLPDGPEHFRHTLPHCRHVLLQLEAALLQ